MNEFIIPKKVVNKYKRIHKKFCKLHNFNPGFWKPNRKNKKFIEKYIEAVFPEEHHGEAIGGIFYETASLRSLLIDAMDYGYEMGRDPKKLKNKENQLKQYMKELNQLTMRFKEYKKREFFVEDILPIKTISDKIVFQYRKQQFIVSIVNYKNELNRICSISDQI